MADDLTHSKGEECLPLAVRRKIDQSESSSMKWMNPGPLIYETQAMEKDAVLKIIAGLLGLGLDEIKQH